MAVATKAAPKAERKARTVKPREPYLANGAAKLTALPVDFVAGTHKALTSDDFAEPAMFYEWRAHQHDVQAAKCREEADAMRKYGTPEKRAAKKKLETMAKKMKEMQAALAEVVGADAVQELLEQIGA